MRILIAEDDPVSRRFLEAKLTKWGYEVAVACDGNEAWRILQAENAPTIAVLDRMMPGMGWTASRFAERSGRSPASPIRTSSSLPP